MFYCSARCQQHHWIEHKVLCHNESPPEDHHDQLLPSQLGMMQVLNMIQAMAGLCILKHLGSA